MHTLALPFLKMLFVAFAFVGVLALLASTAFAFHPGQSGSGTVPQGPHRNACLNEGRQGINEAISRGGMVHCERHHEGPRK